MRSPGMEEFIERLRVDFGISDEFIAASEHPASCRCDICLDWWAQMGPEDPGAEREYPSAPFTDEEIKARMEQMRE